MNIHEFDLHKEKLHIYPSIRSEEMINVLNKDMPNGDGVIMDEVFLDLKQIYFLYKEGYNIPINTTMLQMGEGLAIEEVKKQANENMLQQGWIKHTNIGNMVTGDLYEFSEGKRLFHSQFFVPEWIKEHFGNEFYFGFPTKEIAYVFVPKKNYKINPFLYDRNYVHEKFIKEDFNHSKYPISDHLFVYRHGEYQIVL